MQGVLVPSLVEVSLLGEVVIGANMTPQKNELADVLVRKKIENACIPEEVAWEGGMFVAVYEEHGVA